MLDVGIDQVTGGQNDAARGLGLYPDGRFVAVSSLLQSGGSNSLIVRYNLDGSRDTSFGGYGTGARIDSWGSGNDNLQACVVQPADSKLVATGLVVGAVKNTGADGLVVRYTAAGLPDTSFGTGGRSVVFASKEADICRDVAVQSDGKIVAVGGGDNLKGKGIVNGPKRTLVGRLLANGALDTTFGTGGVVALSVGSGSSEAGAVAIQANGKIVVGGDCAEGMFVLRLNLNGTLDTGFGAGGIRLVSVPGVRHVSGVGGCLRLQGDEKIVLGGSADYGPDLATMTLVRLNPNGGFDTTFNGTGIQASEVPSTIYSLVLNPAGDIIACGAGNENGPDGILVARFTSSGQPDAGFNASGATPGYVFRVVGMPGGFGWSIVYRPNDDTILVGGRGFLPDYTGVLGFLRIEN